MSRTMERIEAIRRRLRPKCAVCGDDPVRMIGTDRAGNTIDSAPDGTCPACGRVALIEVHTPGLDFTRI